MYAYLALVSERSLDLPEIEARVAAAADRSLGWITGLQQGRWRSATGRSSMWWWTNEPTPFTGRVVTDAQAAVIMIGSLDADLDGLLHARDLPAALVGQAGDYSVCRLADDQATAVSTFTRQMPVYAARTGDTTCVGSRALLIHLFCRDGAPLEFDMDCLASTVSTGYGNGGFWSDRTPFKGVQLAQPNSLLEATRDGLRSVDNGSAYARFGTGDAVPDEAFFDELADVFLAGLRRLDLPQGMEVALTGGKDSRVLVTALNNLDLGLTVGTAGFDSDPDVVVAKTIADHLGLPHRQILPESSTETSEATLSWDLRGNVGRELLVYDAMMITVEGLPRRASNRAATVDADFSETPVIATKGAEIWRSGYANRDFSWIPPDLAADQVTRDYMDRTVRELWLRNAGLLTADLRQSHERYVSEWLSVSGIEKHPTSAAERFYLEFEIGRRDPPYLFGYLLARPTHQPFMQQEIVRKIAQLDVRYRRDDHVHYELIKRFAPGVEDIPLERKRWGFEWLGPRAEVDRRAWEARAPLPVNPRTYGAWPFYGALGADYAGPVAEQLFSFPDGDNIWAFLQRDVLHDLFFSERIFDPHIAATFWVAYGLSVLMEGSWLDPAQPELMITARHRVPWPAIYGGLVRRAREAQDAFIEEIQAALEDLDDYGAPHAADPTEPKVVANTASFAGAIVYPGPGRTAEVEAPADGRGWRVVVKSEPGSPPANSYVAVPIEGLKRPNPLSLELRLAYRAARETVAATYLVRYVDGERLEVPGPVLQFGRDVQLQEHTFKRLGPALPEDADPTYSLLLGLGADDAEIEFNELRALAVARPVAKDVLDTLVRDGCLRLREVLDECIRQLGFEHELTDEQLTAFRQRAAIEDVVPAPQPNAAADLLAGDSALTDEVAMVADRLLQGLMACAP